ncbi:hypothetical protein GDO86_018915 [Hymenochirus boettgeri]|uniref:G-protein coupled receptors family 1 profile domain-containing protein n=1 Tax=Hymenochirus boettgeri TaxID=247094 RepID=A0A8T2IDW4_9PIPI|nr:hypothetical protein GDO86_018915 [Hymenochirus boettgeri]
MAFDRYVAICNPLHYTNIMSYKLCPRLVGGTWLVGLFYSLLHTPLTGRINFCGPNQINHIYGDILPLFQLACSDITLNLYLLYASAFLNGICNFSVILSSYTRIVLAILRIKAKKERIKAFSTCSSHIVVVSVFISPLLALILVLSVVLKSPETGPVLFCTTCSPLFETNNIQF